MSDETKEEVPMAECGACRAIVPLNSENCPECNISFTGVSDEALGECGACHGLVPLDSTKCPHCGTIFVADDVVEVLRKWLETTGISIPTLFKKFDTNNDNLIDSSELKTGLLSLNLADLPPSQVERLVNTIDEDGDGQIDLSELHETITGVEYESEEIDQPSTDTEPEKDDSVDEVDGDSDEDEKPLENTDEDSDGGSEMDDSMEDSMDVDPDEEDDDVLESDEVEDEPVVESEEIEDFEDEELDEGYVAEMDDVDEIDNEIQSPQSILQLISDAMDESGDSPNKFFNALDNDGNGQISAAEFKESISDLIGSEVTHKDIESFLSDADEDNDGTIDIIEFVEILESLDDTDDAIDDEARLSKKVDKPFPTDLQRKMMGKKWNDVVWPLIHMTFGLFIAAWLINGMGGIGPLSVSGEGGPIALETSYKIGYESWEEGDIYPCEPDVQVGECRNSLTPLSGDSSSMPAGFYWDGILMMVLGTVGLLGSLAMHFVVVPGWRARSKAMKEVSDDTDEARTENSNDEDDAEPEADVEEEADDGEELDDEEEVFDDEEDDESEDDEDEDADGDDEIDIGSHIGLAFEDEDVFGTIIEFDDEEETVTIEEDGSGDLVTGYQKDIFLE
ncbi:EF-hand domain-containing protein [Candidatus Poseidoniaceae archaeon]|nr:EF-hand domain-containing protein [Candidatus Poseidoniaceae archaeon]